MKKSLFLLLVLVIGIQISCETDNDTSIDIILTDPCETVFPTPEELRYEAVYDQPIVLNADNPSFYSNEIVEITWTLPEGLSNTELQIIETDTPFSCDDYSKFHDLNNDFSAGYGNQNIHYYITNEIITPLENPKYISYRVRSTDIELMRGYSQWTDVKSFSVLPLSGLNKTTITVPYLFNFITEEVNNEYYSGIISFPNYRLNTIAADNSIDYDKIRSARIIDFESNFITQLSGGENPFTKLILGFDEDINPNENAYPFDVFGEFFPGTFQESPISGNLYGTYSKNLVSDLNNYDLKLAYVLEDTVGSQHEVVINITYEIYTID